MFKINSFEDEIYSSMEKSLVKAQTEEQYGFDKLAKAVNYLNSAAIIFEKAGMLKEADEVTGVLESIVKDTVPEEFNIPEEVHGIKINPDLVRYLLQAKLYLNRAKQSTEGMVGALLWSKNIDNIIQPITSSINEMLFRKAPKSHLKTSSKQLFLKNASDLLNVKDLESLLESTPGANFNMEDLKNLLKSTPEAHYVMLAKKVLSIIKGDSTLADEIKDSLHELDLSDPEVREGLTSKIMTAIKLAKRL